MLEFILYSIALVCLLLGSVSDIKKLEIPDYISYFMISAGIGIRLLYSLLENNFFPFFDGLLGFAAFYLMGIAMYYTGQWGGGDAKVMMGFGALSGIGLGSILAGDVPFPLIAFFYMLFSGAVIGIIYSAVLYFRNKGKAEREFRIIRKKSSALEKAVLIISGIMELLIFLALMAYPEFGLNALMLAFPFIAVLMLYLSLFLKAVQESCMNMLIPPEKLTEGDWLVNDIVVAGKTVVKKNKTGLELSELKKILALKRKGKIRLVKVKYGMPFVPSFFAGLIVALVFQKLAISLFP
jgi:Flp pilus assembly protein protease CpaA